MKANLFALFCITLFVLSVPQTFAQTESVTTEDQTPEETTTETPVEIASTPVEEEAPSAEPTEVPIETQEPVIAEEKSDDDEEVAAEEPEVTAAPETEESESDSDEVVAEPIVTETPVTETQPEQEVIPAAPETSAEGEQGQTGEVQAGESNDAPQTGENTAVVADPEGSTETTAAPTETTETTDATNTEPAAPVGVPEENQQETTAATEESHETVPVAEGEEGDEAKVEEKDDFSVFGLIGKVLIGVGVLALMILVGCVYNYRYQMKKYKIAPFTPPSFLPECLFPRSTESTGRLVSGYTELQVGNYQSAPRFAEV